MLNSGSTFTTLKKNKDKKKGRKANERLLDLQCVKSGEGLDLRGRLPTGILGCPFVDMCATVMRSTCSKLEIKDLWNDQNNMMIKKTRQPQLGVSRGGRQRDDWNGGLVICNGEETFPRGFGAVEGVGFRIDQASLCNSGKNCKDGNP